MFESTQTLNQNSEKSHHRRGSDLSHDNFSVASSTHRHALVPSGYAIVPHSPQVSLVPTSIVSFCHALTSLFLQRASNPNNIIIFINEDLTFNSQQLSVLFIAMVVCYYMGKFGCSC
jgi:hypothetical protein